MFHIYFVKYDKIQMAKIKYVKENKLSHWIKSLEPESTKSTE